MEGGGGAIGMLARSNQGNSSSLQHSCRKEEEDAAVSASACTPPQRRDMSRPRPLVAYGRPAITFSQTYQKSPGLQMILYTYEKGQIVLYAQTAIILIFNKGIKDQYEGIAGLSNEAQIYIFQTSQSGHTACPDDCNQHYCIESGVGGA